MPRYDDRLDNVLELLKSNEHSNSDTIFRHMSDILVQESAWMDGSRRALIVKHLCDIYPKTTQSARMEVMDIAAQAPESAPELVRIAAADTSIIGTRLWDRVRLPSQSWHSILPDLPKAVLGRLRARLDLPDDVVVAIDRTWRERIKVQNARPPYLSETLDDLRSGVFTPTQAQDTALEVSGEDSEIETLESEDAIAIDLTADDLVVTDRSVTDLGNNALEETATGQASREKPGQNIFERAFERNLANGGTTNVEPPQTTQPTIDVAADVTRPPLTIEAAGEGDNTDALSDTDSSLLFVPSQDDSTGLDTTDTPDTQEPIDLTELLTPEVKPSDNRTMAAHLDPEQEKAAAKVIDFPQNEDLSDAFEPDTDGTDPDASAEAQGAALGESPQVEDPKIQDILARLREFGSRSKNRPEAEETAPDTRDDTPLDAPAFAAEPVFEEPATQDVPAEEEHREDESEKVNLFLSEQPDDDEPNAIDEVAGSDTFEEAIFSADEDARFQPVTVHGTTWVTDRFGTLVECFSRRGAAFGLPHGELEGQILSSLFEMPDQKTLDIALHGRTAFRDMRLTATADEKMWVLSAVPVFDDESGIFLGHRGTASNLTLAAGTQTAESLAPKPQLARIGTLDIASLAHELKTPLNAIRGFAEMIETQQLGPASAFARDRSQKIGLEADQLHQVLNDLLLPKTQDTTAPADGKALLPILQAALEPFAANLTLSGLNSISLHTTTTLDPAFLSALTEKLVHIGALWSPAHSTLHIEVTADGPSSVTVCAQLPAWTGAADGHALKTIESGPRLSYRHPLEDKTSLGRGVAALMPDIEATGARIFARRAGRQAAGIVLAIPVKTSQT